MTSKELVLVTGASGFVGAQIVEHLLQAGYAVRGTCRSAKADLLRNNSKHPDFEVVIVDDLIESDFSEALHGVKAVIHNASPLPQGSNHIEVAVAGTLNLVRRAQAVGVFKVTVISSMAATASFIGVPVLYDASRVINDQDWNPITRAQAHQLTDPFSQYVASKALAERALWEFADSHGEMDIMTILPPYIYGPVAPRQVILEPKEELSTNRLIYLLIAGASAVYPPKITPQFVDVRDVAKACVLSLKARPPQPGERRRILLCGGSFTWKEAAHHLGTVKPELKERLVDKGEVMGEDLPAAAIDTTKAAELLGMTEFIGWKKSVEDTVDSLLQREHTWLRSASL